MVAVAQPTTTEAKVFAMALMVVGIGHFAVSTGAMAERFIQRSDDDEVEAVEADAADDLSARIDRLALRASEMATELEALLAVTMTAARANTRHRATEAAGERASVALCSRDAARVLGRGELLY
jgi:hypothetical protein